MLTDDLVVCLWLKVTERLFYCRIDCSWIAHSAGHKEGSQWRDWWVGVITAGAWCHCWLPSCCYQFSEARQESGISVKLFKIRIYAEQSKILPNSRGQYGSPLCSLCFQSQGNKCIAANTSNVAFIPSWLPEENGGKTREKLQEKIGKALDVCNAHLNVVLCSRKETTG